jgi:hypothetical protein
MRSSGVPFSGKNSDADLYVGNVPTRGSQANTNRYQMLGVACAQ